ncbi:MAG TPA: hypothetical protein VIL92_06275 [Gaiellaceae bacterium]
MTFRWKGPEAIIDAAVAKLQAGMSVHIATINSEDTAGVTITVPDTAQYFTAAQRLYPPGPCVIVFDGRVGLAGGKQEGSHQVMTETTLGVYVLDDDMDEQHLNRKLQRLNAAAIETLLDDAPVERLNDAGGSQIAWRIAFRESQASPVFHPDSDGAPLRASRVTIFSATRLEQ